MRIWDFEKIFFRINVAATVIIFILLAPTTQIFAWWFPGKKDELWLFPFLTALISAFLWILMSFSLPLLIKLGIFEDRRRDIRRETVSFGEKALRVAVPVLGFMFHILMLIFICVCIVLFMRSDAFERLFVNLP